MAQIKYYAVRKGKNTGIFRTWAECEKEVKGFSGAQYKSFPTEQEAKDYLEEIKVVESEQDEIDDLDIFGSDASVVIAHVQGGYNDYTLKYSFGCIIRTPFRDELKFCGYNNKPGALSSKQVAGELLGVMFAVKWAFEKGYKAILIRHEYDGALKWFKGDWNAKVPCTKEYTEFCKEYSQKINIQFKKNKVNSEDVFIKDKYNRWAQGLAKDAAEKGVNILG